MNKRRVRIVAPVVLLVVSTMWLISAIGPAILNWAANEDARRTRRLGRHITDKHGVVFLVTFDEPAVREWITGAHCLAPGTESAPGRHRRGRVFDGRHQTFVETSASWSLAGSNYTVSVWAKLDRASKNQDIMYSAGDERQTGFRLNDGMLTFDIPGADRQALEYPFEHYDVFTHLAAVVNQAEGKAVLYVNGERQAELAIHDVRMSSQIIEFGKSEWFAARHPINGMIDEAVIWNRALEPETIRDIYRSRVPVLRKLAPVSRYYAWRITGMKANALRGAAKLFDVGFLWTGSLFSRKQQNRLPRLDLFPNNSDRRYFAASHHVSRESGRRIDGASHPREIYFGVQGQVRKGLLQLYGTDVSYDDNPRPSYILNAADGDAILGMQRLLLTPPENVSFLLPLMESKLASRHGMPNVANGLLTLNVNSRSQGVYYYEDWDKMGVIAGDFDYLFEGPGNVRDRTTLFRNMEEPLFYGRTAHRQLPFDEETLREIYDGVSRKYRAVLMNDLMSPMSRMERSSRMKRDRARISEIWQVAPPELSASRNAADYICEYMMIGSNPSPYRVTYDLDPDRLRLPGVSIDWSSSKTAVIADDGRVTRPSGSRPVAVRMTATIDDGMQTHAKTLTFRVMPARINIPSIMIYARQRVQKIRRIDARIDYYPALTNTSPRVLWATQPARGGLSHRGNTSYWRPKKLFSFRTDEPHHIMDTSRARHLQFINSMEDRTLMKNRLSYDLFRAFGTDDDPRYAPRVEWAEIFVNGMYHGLYEICERVDERMLGLDRDDPGLVHPPLIYKHETVRPRIPNLRQKRPSRRHGYFLDPYLELYDFLKYSPNDRFTADFGEHFDLESVIDFHILLNLSQNSNGYPFPYPTHDILAHSGRPADRFFIVPWDFGRTFTPAWEWRWMANGMQRRLQNEYPGYRERLYERWSELRNDALDIDCLIDTINGYAADIQDYVPWDYDRWQYHHGKSHDEWVSDLKTALTDDIETMDAFLKDWNNP